MLVEELAPLVEDSDDAAVGTGAAQQRQSGEEQQIRQGIALALGASGIWHIVQRCQQTRKCNQGTRPGFRVPSIKSHFFPRR